MKSSKFIIYLGIFLFIIGVFFKVFKEPGAGTLMGFGLALPIYGYSRDFCKKVERKSADYLFLAGIIIISSMIFSIVQHRNYIEIITAAICISLLRSTIEFIYKSIKEL